MALKYVVPALLLSAGLAAPVFASTGNWTAYRDSVYDCRLEYAGTLFTQDPWDATDEVQRFSGHNKDTYFRVRGVSNKENLKPADIRAKYLQANVPGDVVYERTRGDFLVLSGFRGGSIFYTKVAVSSDNRTICILEISYPRKAKRALDAVVTRMSRTFVAGD